MFSIATVKRALGAPPRPVTGQPRSSAVLSNANCCAPLNPPPPNPGALALSGNSS